MKFDDNGQLISRMWIHLKVSLSTSLHTKKRIVSACGQLIKSFYLQGGSWAATAIGSCCFGYDLQPVEWVRTFKLVVYCVASSFMWRRIFCLPVLTTE